MSNMKMGRMLGIYGMLAACSAMSVTYDDRSYVPGENITRPDQIDGTLKQVLPRGCNYWYFDKDGNIVEQNVYYFKCIASNYKSAKRKFDNYQKNR